VKLRILTAVLVIVCVTPLLADSWALGLGGGSSSYLYSDPSYAAGLGNLEEVQTGLRVEAEAGYYTGREGFDVLAVYGESFWHSATRLTLFRDQHLALLGEYRLFVVAMDERLQFAPALGPSVHRIVYYSDGEKGNHPLGFCIDVGAAGIFFSSRHFLMRTQAIYSFRPLYPLRGGTLNVTLRIGYRS
jgi:hypothetical protein